MSVCTCFLKAHLSQSLFLSCGRLSSRGGYFGPPTAFLRRGTGAPRVSLLGHFSNESGSLESQYEELLKSALRLRRSNAHSARTALCGAVLALSGTGAMVSVIPRPVPWHQRLDNRRSPLGASQPKKTIKKKKKTFIGVDNITFLLSPSTIVR